MANKPKLDSKLKAKWLAALRSGKYKQIDGRLCGQREDGKIGHCCLGVLAEIAGVSRARMLDETRSSKTDLGDVGKTKLLGNWTANHGLGKDKDTSTQEFLANMNDDGKSFKRIASWIEKNL